MDNKVELAKAYVQIVPSAKGIKGSLDETLGGEADKAGEKAGKSIGSKIKGAIIAAGIGKAIQTVVGEGAKLEQSIGGIETLFKDSADTVRKYANEAYKTVGLSANDYMEQVTSFSASLLQSLGGDTAKAAEIANIALIDMGDNTNKMGTSMESIQNAYNGFAKQNYTMLDNLKLGYGGTKAEMERLLADAQKISGVKYDISNLSDVYSAIHVVQEELGITGTTAKEASTTVTGSMASMGASFKNLIGDLALGNDISASFRALTDSTLTYLTGNLFPMVATIFKQVPALISQVLSEGIRMLNLAGDNADHFIQSGISLVQELIVGVVSAIPYFIESGSALVAALIETIVTTDWIGVANDLITQLKDSMAIASGEIFGSDDSIISAFMQSVISGLPSVLQMGVDLIIEFVNGILSAIPLMLDELPKIITEFSNYITDILPIIMGKGVELLTKFTEGIVGAIPEMLQRIPAIVQAFLNFFTQNLPVIFSKGVELLVNMATGIINAIPQMLEKIPQIITAFVGFMHQNLPTFIKTGFELIKTLVDGIISAIPVILSNVPKIVRSIIDILKEAPKAVVSVGKDIVTGIWNGVQDMAQWLMDKVKGFAKGIVDKVKDTLKIHSPSKVFELEVGKMLPLGMAVGIENNTDPVDEALQKLNADARGVIDTSIDFSGKINTPVRFENNNSIQVIIELLKLLVQKGETDESNILERILLILNDFLPQFSQRQLVLDSGVLAGELAPLIDEELGRLEYRNGR